MKTFCSKIYHLQSGSSWITATCEIVTGPTLLMHTCLRREWSTSFPPSVLFHVSFTFFINFSLSKPFFSTHSLLKNIPRPASSPFRSRASLTGRRRIDGHVVGGVVEELRPGVSLDIVRVVVSPSQLNVQPVLLRRRVVHHISSSRILFNKNNGSFIQKNRLKWAMLFR